MSRRIAAAPRPHSGYYSRNTALCPPPARELRLPGSLPAARVRDRARGLRRSGPSQ